MFYINSLGALKSETVQGSLNKVDIEPQMLVIDSTHNDRKIDFKINNSTWQYVSNTKNARLRITGGMIQEVIALYPEMKTLKMRTSGIHIGPTPVGGSWWTSGREYLQIGPR